MDDTTTPPFQPKFPLSNSGYRLFSLGYHTSPIVQDLTILETFTDMYLMTCRFTNSCGCFPLVKRVMAAEAKMSVDEFLNNLNRLECANIVSVIDNHILMKNWFFHHKVNATLLGKVAKAVENELAGFTPRLRHAWRESTIGAGVTEALVNKFVTPVKLGPSEDPSKGLPHNNENLNENFNQTTTLFVCGDSRLILTEQGEKYRSVIEAAADGIPLERAQAVADEFCQRLRLGKDNEKMKILDPNAWISKMMISSNFELRVGRTLAEERQQAIKLAEQERLQSEEKKAQATANIDQQQMVEDYLSSLDQHALSEIASDIIANLPKVYVKKADEIKMLIQHGKTGGTYIRDLIVKHVLRKMGVENA